MEFNPDNCETTGGEVVEADTSISFKIYLEIYLDGKGVIEYRPKAGNWD